MGDWLTWVLRTGRGWGKTATGAGWVHERAEQEPGRWMAFVAKTPADARDYMIEGPAGVLRNPPLWCLDAPNGPWPKYEPSKRRITWPNGSWATVFSSEEPDGLRGFSGDTAWLDEYCFVAGTMVGTERGPVPIENVQSGMMVRTRAGFRPVVEHRLSHPAAEVYRLTLDDGRTLTGTGGHPIWVEGEGFIPLRSVSKGSVLVTCQSTPFAADRNVAAFTELRVRGVELLSAKQPVYNLEVAETPEYFANGILVHNCKYKNPREVYENLQFGMREVSADRPRVFISTTPRPVPILMEIEEQPTTVVVTGSSYENRANLAPEWFTQTLAAYEGTRLGRQEIHGELLDDVEGLVYSSFSKAPFPAGNVDASVVDTGAEILVGQDFNVNPMASVIGVKVADELHILDALEVHTSNTEEVAGELRRRYPGRRIIVCPDPAGKARHTSSPVGQTDFTILQRAGFDVRAPKAAPLVVDRVNNTQAMLLQGGRRRVRIHPRAKALIRALSGLTYKEGTSIVDKGSGLDHCVDALGYLCWEEFRVLRPPPPTIRYSHVRI